MNFDWKNLDWKKLSVIALFVAGVVLFGFFLYYFFFRPFFAPEEAAPVNVNAPITGQLPVTVNINGRIFTVNVNGQLPLVNENINALLAPLVTAEPAPTAQGGLTTANRLTNQPSLFVTAGAAGQLIYYNSADGKFYRLTAAGDIQALSTRAFNNVTDVTWSNSREQAILEYPDGSKIVYNFTTGRQTTLPAHWNDFSFSPNDQQIAFKNEGLDPANRFLVAAKPDGSNPVVLESLGDNGDKFDVNWSPNNQMVATFTAGKDLNRSEVYFIGLNNENFKLMLVEGRGFESVWSPAGDRLVYSVYNSDNDYRPQLWIADANPDTIGDNRRSLGLNTWADKCVFATATKLYCAVPATLPFGAGLDKSSADDVPDQIYQIDLNTGAKTLLAIPEGRHTISRLIVDEPAGNLFFADKNNNRIYQINL